jgi:hypothetical protein
MCTQNYQTCGRSSAATTFAYLRGLMNFGLAWQPVWLLQQFKGSFTQLVQKGGKAGWNKGCDVTRMIVLDLGVNSAILQCDSRTRLMRGPVSPAYAYG